MVSFSEYKINVPYGSSGEIKALCPQCSSTRKPQNQNKRELSVNIDKGTWHCWHCGWTGGLGQKEEPTYTRPEYPEPDLPDHVVQYFAGRKIGKRILSEMKIGYRPKKGEIPGAIMFPTYKNGQVVAIKYRTHDKRMWQNKNPEPCFYNYDSAKSTDNDTLVICEGEIDCLSFLDAGITNCVSVPNGAPTPNSVNLENKFKFLDLMLLEKFSRVIIATDTDEPGLFLREKLADKIGKHRCYQVTYPDGCKDANDVLVNHGPEKLRDMYREAKPFPVDGLYTALDVEKKVIDLFKAGLKPGLSTGWPALDQLYTVRECELSVVTGMPGSGKSTWLDALTVNLQVKHGWKIAYCSPENWPIERHVANIVEKIQKRPFMVTKFSQSEKITAELLNEALQLIEGKFFFTQLQDEKMTIPGVLEVMQAAISRHKVKGIVLDPWNELEYHRPQNISETEFISMALGKIRRFARNNRVHIWLVAHPTKLQKNKDNTYPVPRLYDISGSAHFYNKADNGISIHRTDPQKNHVDIHVQKIRFKEIGRLGSVTMGFSADCGLYHEINVKNQNYTEAPF